MKKKLARSSGLMMLTVIGPEGTRALSNLFGSDAADIETTIQLMPYEWKKVLLDNAVLVRKSYLAASATPNFFELLALAREVCDTAVRHLVQDSDIVRAIKELARNPNHPS